MEAKTSRESDLELCISIAEKDRWNTLKSNSTADKNGNLQGIPAHVVVEANKQKKDDVDACLARFK